MKKKLNLIVLSKEEEAKVLGASYPCPCVCNITSLKTFYKEEPKGR